MEISICYNISIHICKGNYESQRLLPNLGLVALSKYILHIHVNRYIV